MRMRVYCTTRFEAFHLWPGAPARFEYLGVRHRHMFHVRAEVCVREVARVRKADRVVEFIDLKHRVDEAIADMKSRCRSATWSCEQWAIFLIMRCGLDRCEVSEDGENGAVVDR